MPLSLLSLLLLLIIGNPASSLSTPTSTPTSNLISSYQLPLSTSGRHIVDNAMKPVRLAAVNWYGAHMEEFVVGGLSVKTLQTQVDAIIKAGFNCVRLPYSLDLIFKGIYIKPPALAIAANPDMDGLNALEIFDLTIKACTDSGLLILLNNHNSKAGWCCDENSSEGLWANEAYSGDQWVDHYKRLATRYLSNPLVIGADLRNEIHDVAPMERYIDWGVTKELESDWKYATEKAASEIYNVNPDWLIVVSGLCFSFDLRFLANDPPVLKQVKKLVWTTHYYSFSRWWKVIEWKDSGEDDGVDHTIFDEGFDAEKEVGEALGGFQWEKLSEVCRDIAIVSGLILVAVTVYVALKRCGKIEGCKIVPKRKGIHFVALCYSVPPFLILFGVLLRSMSSSIRDGYKTAGCANVAMEADMIDALYPALFVSALVVWGLGCLGFFWLGGMGCFPTLEERVERSSSDKHFEMRQVEDGEELQNIGRVSVGSRMVSTDTTTSSISSTPSTALTIISDMTMDTLDEQERYQLWEREKQAKQQQIKQRKIDKQQTVEEGRELATSDEQCFFCQFAIQVMLQIMFFALLIVLGVSSFFVWYAGHTETYEMLEGELKSKWMMGEGMTDDDNLAPVLLGEFGTSQTAGNVWWDQMMRFLNENEMSWAYWAWNGGRWNNETGAYGEEGYGIMDFEYENYRDVGGKKVADLRAVGGEF